MKHHTHKLAAVITAAFMAHTGDAFAQNGTNFSSVADNIVDSTKTIPNLISTVGYIGGIGLGVAGIFKLKQHVDNPGQTPMKDGLVRLGSGGGLLALPYVSKAMLGTISDGSSNNGVSPDNLKFDAVNFN